MEIGKIHLITFSPTQTSKQVGEAIVRGTGITEVIHQDLTHPEKPLQEVPGDALAIVAVPVYGGRVAPLAIKRLEQLKGNNTPAILIVVYGNRAYEDALLELHSELTANGFKVVAAAAFIAEHSIVRGIAAGRPHSADCEKAAAFAAAVNEKLSRGDMNVVCVPGNLIYRERPKMPVVPVTLDNCGGCGRCARLCPVGAIPAEAPHTTDASKCILCMRCVTVCFRRSRLLPPPVLESMTQRLNLVAAEPKMPEIYI